MTRIKVLPDILANQIAAGEVVERPASAVKELLENSIDAGATQINIDVELGGRRLLRISDNGSGMERDDAILAFERHATSKISVPEDLGRIGTLGFRGEALASIASVAKIELVTKTEESETATAVNIEGGRLIDVRDAGRATGTTIAVSDLFYNTPARRKFMRSEATENYHLTSIVTHYALSYPAISFTLMNNGREILRLSSARNLRERAYQIFGSDIIESLLPVSGGREYVANISGYVSAPRERRTNRDSQYFFVNNRFVKDKIIAEGLREGFRSVLPHGSYPVAFLFLEIPLEEIDVNVHPAKTEIRFRRKDAVKDVIAEAVRESLAKSGVLILNDDARNIHIEPQEMRSSESWGSSETGERPNSNANHDKEFSDGNTANSRSADAESHVSENARSDKSVANERSLFDEILIPDTEISFGFEMIAEQRSAANPEPQSQSEKIADQGYSNYAILPPVDSAAKIVRSAEVENVSSSTIRPIGQLHDSFIIAVDEEGLLLIDQHVAHERILFDKFRKAETERPIQSQNLLLPETLDLSPAQAAAYQIIEQELTAMGFGLMQLSGRTIAIKSVPTDLPAAEARNLFAELLDGFEPEKRGDAKSTMRDNIAASLACKAAVKINMKLTPEKMQWMIDRLLITSSPTTCPHGRPVILRLTMKDIERGFHRT